MKKPLTKPELTVIVLHPADIITTSDPEPTPEPTPDPGEWSPTV